MQGQPNAEIPLEKYNQVIRNEYVVSSTNLASEYYQEHRTCVPNPCEYLTKFAYMIQSIIFELHIQGVLYKLYLQYLMSYTELDLSEAMSAMYIYHIYILYSSNITHIVYITHSV